MIFLENLEANSIKGYKSKSSTHDEMKNKIVQKALKMDDMKNIFIRMGWKYGISIALVNPRYTSQECSHCHKIEKENRDSGNYDCSCGFSGNADINAAINIRNRMSNEVKRKNLQYVGKHRTLGIWLWMGRNYINKKMFEVG